MSEVFQTWHIEGFFSTVGIFLTFEESHVDFFRFMSENCFGLLAAIGGPTGELLEQNAQALNQISANIAAFQVTDDVFWHSQFQLFLCKIKSA